MPIELLDLKTGRISFTDTMRFALERADAKKLTAYRITEIGQHGRVLRVQVGSSST